MEDFNETYLSLRERVADLLTGLPHDGLAPPIRTIPLDELVTGFSPCHTGEKQIASSPSEALDINCRFIVHGPSGSGRSTLLQFLAAGELQRIDGYVPLLVSLRDFTSPNHFNALRDYAVTRASHGDEGVAAAITQLLPSKRLLWLLDDCPPQTASNAQLMTMLARLPGALVLVLSDTKEQYDVLPQYPHYDLTLPSTADVPQMITRFCRQWSNSDDEARDLGTLLVEQFAIAPPLWKALCLPFHCALFVSGGRLVGTYPRSLSQLYQIGLQTLAPTPLTELASKRSLWEQYARAKRIVSAWGERGTTYFDEKLKPNLHRSGFVDPVLLAAGEMNSEQATAMIEKVLRARSPYEAALKRDLRCAARLLGERYPHLEGNEARLLAPILSSLETLVGKHDWRYPFIVGTVFILGSIALFFGLEQPLREQILLIWTCLWILAFSVPYFPFFRDKLALPARWFKPPPDTTVFVESIISLGHHAVPVLHAALLSVDNPDSQRLAACQLARLKKLVPPPVVDSLCTVLCRTDCRDDVRTATARALSHHQTPETIRTLSYILRSRTAEMSTRSAAAESLAAMDARHAWEALVEGLDHQDHTIRLIAAAAVSRSKQRAAATARLIELAADRYPDVRIAALASLATIQDEAIISAAIQCLDDHNEDVRQQATKTLSRYGDAAVTAIAEFLRRPALDIAHRVSAIDGLRACASPAIIAPASACLDCEEHQLRAAAIAALAATGLPAVAPTLETATRDEWGAVRSAALIALTDICGAKARNHLATALRDRDRNVRRVAITQLLALRAPGVVSDLLVTLEDNDFEVRRDGARALGRLADRQALPVLMAAAEDVNSHVRAAALTALSFIGATESIDSIAIALTDRDADVQCAATEALARFPVETFLPILRQVMEADDTLVRRNAIATLANNGSAASLSVIAAALDDSDSEVRCTAAAALVSVDDGSTEPRLVNLLTDSCETVRAQAAVTIGQVGTLRGTTLLISLLADPESFVRCTAVSALGNIGAHDALEAMTGLLDDTNWEVRKAAIRSLAALAIPAAVPPLTNLLTAADPETRRRTMDGLVSLGLRCTDLDTRQKIAAALWWRLTDERTIAISAFRALETVLAHHGENTVGEHVQ